MLSELRVRGLAVIRDARCELGPGLNVLTGETGAGKSMLVDALSLLLGDRAAADLVRPGAERAVVEGAFDPPDSRDLRAVLSHRGIDMQDGRLILKREIQPAGRSRSWINGSPVTAGVLAEVGRRLVDLHGQHDTQSLLSPDSQRAILDSYAGAAAVAEAVGREHGEVMQLRAELEELRVRQAQARRRADYLRHVALEIGRAGIRRGEQESLDGEARRLAHAEELGRTAEELGELLDGDERSLTALVARASRLIAQISRIDPASAAGWTELLDQAAVQSAELGAAVREYASGVEADPERLAAVERRRALLFELDRKYGPGEERVLAALEEARRELALLDTADLDLAELEGRLAAGRQRLLERCRELSALRRAAAGKLAGKVTAALPGLGMAKGRFRVALEALDAPGPAGAESVDFLVSLNPGMGERALAREASGGELSRLMLAIKVELSDHDAVPTLVFDEVDQGVGGHVAGRLAESLARVAERHQVLVITHLPQVAAAASRHLVVTKEVTEGATEAGVRTLGDSDRVEEVARMLGGPAPSARRHARELLSARS